MDFAKYLGKLILQASGECIKYDLLDLKRRNTMNLTPKELLTAMKYCRRMIGGPGCDGCPNQKPDGEVKYGISECRFNLNDEIMGFLEECCRKEES